MIEDVILNHASAVRRLGFVAALCGTSACAILFAGPARAGDGDGLLVQHYYESRQIDCARRWRDHKHMFGCVGFDEAMPFARVT